MGAGTGTWSCSRDDLEKNLMSINPPAGEVSKQQPSWKKPPKPPKQSSRIHKSDQKSKAAFVRKNRASASSGASFLDTGTVLSLLLTLLFVVLMLFQGLSSLRGDQPKVMENPKTDSQTRNLVDQHQLNIVLE